MCSCGLRLICKSIEDGLFLFQHVHDPLIDRIHAKQPVYQHIPRLSHPICPGYGLIFNGRLKLWFADNNHTCGLDIQAGAAGLYLTDKDGPRWRFIKLVDDFLPASRRYGSVDRVHTFGPQ